MGFPSETLVKQPGGDTVGIKTIVTVEKVSANYSGRERSYRLLKSCLCTIETGIGQESNRHKAYDKLIGRSDFLFPFRGQWR